MNDAETEVREYGAEFLLRLQPGDRVVLKYTPTHEPTLELIEAKEQPHWAAFHEALREVEARTLPRAVTPEEIRSALEMWREQFKA